MARVRAVLSALCCAAAAQDPSAYIEQQMSQGNIPGLSAAVIRGDEVVWHGGFGSAWPERGGDADRVTNETAFTFASISKTITGVAALILHERGLVDFDQDIDTYLPFTMARSGITLAMLMTHTSSIRDSYYFSIPERDIYTDHDPLISLLDFNVAMFTTNGRWYSTRTFSGSPGGSFSYSNIASSLAAGVVEEIAKSHGLAADYDAFVLQHIFAPLRVTLGSHYLRKFPGGMEPPIGARPSRHCGGSYRSYEHYSVPDYPNGFWRSSAETYARVLGMVANRGTFQGAQVLSHASAEILRERTSADGGTQGRAFFYYRSNGMLGHTGGEMGISTTSFFSPSSGVGYCILTNADRASTIGNIENHLMQLFDDTYQQKGGNATWASSDVGRGPCDRHPHHPRHPDRHRGPWDR